MIEAVEMDETKETIENNDQKSIQTTNNEINEINKQTPIKNNDDEIIDVSNQNILDKIYSTDEFGFVLIPYQKTPVVWNYF